MAAMQRQDSLTGTGDDEQSFTVEELMANNPYNPELLPDLENYVNEQVSSQTYSLDANLCLLRHYQFEPERLSIPIVVRILIKALMAMPAVDFSLCLFLIPEQVQMDDQIKILTVLSHFLETCRFGSFWDEASKHRDILDAVPGFEQAVRSYAIHVLSLTYSKVPKSVVAEVTNLNGAALDNFLEHQVAAGNSGWALEKGELIVLPKNESNHPDLKRSAADGASFEQIARIYPLLS